jgi:hypothetical protein
MKTLLLALLLFTGSAWAEWIKVFKTAKGDFYFDPASIRSDDNRRSAWEIQNLKQPGTDGELSNRIRSEYDCKQGRYRFLSLSAHSEPMAGGKTLLQTSEEDTKDAKWRDVPPNTTVAIMLKIVCAR